MHLAEAYRSLARPSSALEPSHPLAGIFADLISYAPLNSVSVWSQSLYTASQALFRPLPFPKESTSLGAHYNGLAGIRTQGLCLAKAALYQLSYKPQLVR